MIIEKYFHDIVIGIEAIFANKLKSMLTALGIIFGVAAVISMMAIGNGAEQEILEQIKMVGVNNIIITPSEISKEGVKGDSDSDGGGANSKFSRGLTLLDVDAIREIIPTVEKISPVISEKYSIIIDGKSKPVILEGVNESYFDLFNIRLEEGRRFDNIQGLKGQPVCVIGNNVKNEFFNQESPLGEKIKVGNIWLTVIGVIEQRDFTASASDEMGISSSDNKVFVPAETFLMRFVNRSLIRADEIEKANSRMFRSNKNEGTSEEEPNQLNKIIVQVKETEQLTNTSNIITRLLLRRHSGVYDFEVTIPELLLKQEQQTRKIFNIVLGAIAGISLIVGGIGIMNIMLASVLERIREIGTRQAIGASRKDIIVQFLSESTLISIAGGFIGIMLGVILSKLVTAIFDIKTVVSFFSVFIAFSVSAAVGIIFGYLPAKQAAEKDPVESLRY